MPESFWLTVWWLTVVAAVAAAAVFVVHWWRARRRPRLHGACFYLDEDEVMGLYQMEYRAALEQEVEERVVGTKDLTLLAQVYGVEAGATRTFNREVLRRYIQTFTPITVIGTIIDALEAADGVIHVRLRTRRVEQNRALRNAMADENLELLRGNKVRLRDLDVPVSVRGRFRCTGAADGITVFLAPYGDPADPTDGPQVRIECVTTGLRDRLPTGRFPARCLGKVQDWDADENQLVIRPIAIFR